MWGEGQNSPQVSGRVFSGEVGGRCFAGVVVDG